jgi:hypothetical protein
MKAQRGSRGINLPFVYPGGKMWVGVQHHTLAALPPGKRDTVPIVQEAGWAPGPFWMGAENFSPPSRGFDPRPVHPVVGH